MKDKKERIKNIEETALKIEATNINIENEEENPGIGYEIVIGSEDSLNWYRKNKSEEIRMENKNYVVNPEECQVVDGKVVISSEELAAAILDQEVVLNAEEEDSFGSGCSIITIIKK